MKIILHVGFGGLHSVPEAQRSGRQEGVKIPPPHALRRPIPRRIPFLESFSYVLAPHYAERIAYLAEGDVVFHTFDK